MSDYWPQAVDYGPLFRRNDPPTSVVSGRRARGIASQHRPLILQALAIGPANRDEIASRCGLTKDAVWRRLSQLEKDGLIERTGEEWPGESGLGQAVYRITNNEGAR